MELNDHSSRDHALLSASSAHRWMACPGSAKIADRYPNLETPYTKEGTLAHEVAEAVASGRVKPENIETNENTGVDAEMVRHATAYRDYIDSLCTEHTSKMLEVKVDFSCWVPGGFGTADCILLHGNTMDVIDYKYGQGVSVKAEYNPQLLLYGLGAFNEYGFVYDVDLVRLHIFQPRLDNISVADYTLKDLLSFGECVKASALDAMEETPILCAGDHCKFCPHAGRCSELAQKSIADCCLGSELTPDPTTLSDAAVSDILRYEPMISIWLKKVKDRALTDLLNGKKIPGYKVVEGRLGNREWADELKVAAALDKAGIAKTDYTETKLLSPAGMDSSLGKKKVVELLKDLIVRKPGSPAVVPESDKRKPLDRLAEAKKDFE